MNRFRAIAGPGAALVLLVFFGESGLRAAAAGEDEGDATFLHILIVADTDNPEMGRYATSDGNKFNNILVCEIPRHRREITTLGGREATRKNIESYYRDLAVKPTDSVLCYYAGRVERSDGEQLLKLADGPPLKRSDLRKMMEAKGARLIVLLTEACHEYGTLHGFASSFGLGAIQASRYLFFRHRGVVDIHAASGTEQAWGVEERGGLFTWALTDSLGLCNEDLDNDEDGIVSWEEFAPLVARETELHFAALKDANKDIGQSSQTLQIYQLAKPISKPIPRSRYRVGIRTFDTDGSGVRIGEVFDDTPAEWHGLKVGEVLYRMATVYGGTETQTFDVRTERDFARTVDAHRNAVMFKCWLRDKASGETRSLYVRLCPPIAESSPPKIGPAAEEDGA